MFLGGTLVALGLGVALPRPAPTEVPAVTAQELPDGREVFERKNCRHCHSVASLEIERTGEQEKQWGPDLSGLGERLDEEEIAELLRRGDPLARGTRHWKKFWGDDPELLALAQWLATLEAVGEVDAGAAREATGPEG